MGVAYGCNCPPMVCMAHTIPHHSPPHVIAPITNPLRRSPVADLKRHGVCSRPGNEVVVVVVSSESQLAQLQLAWTAFLFTVAGAASAHTVSIHALHARVLNERVGYFETSGSGGVDGWWPCVA